MRRRDFLLEAGLLLVPTSISNAYPAAGTSVPVGVRTNFAQGWSDRSARWMITRLRHTMPCDASGIEIAYQNVSRGQYANELPGSNPIKITVQLEFPAGTLHLTAFDGRPEVVVSGGAAVVTDPVPVSIPAGATYYTRTVVKADVAPYRWPYTRVSSTNCGDRVMTGTDQDAVPEQFPEPRSKGAFAFGPCAVFAQTASPHSSVAILGDSVVSGEPGEDRLGDRGFIERGLAAHVAWTNLSGSGDNLAAFLNSHAMRLELLRWNFTHVICALGIGDIRGGGEEAVRNRFLRVWQLLSDLGVKVFQTTITTHTESTDGWTTPEGQSIVNTNFLPGGLRHRINEWIRSAPAPLAGYFDPARLLETSLDSGIWISPGGRPVTNDGPHPNALGAEIAARSIDIDKLRP